MKLKKTAYEHNLKSTEENLSRMMLFCRWRKEKVGPVGIAREIREAVGNTVLRPCLALVLRPSRLQ